MTFAAQLRKFRKERRITQEKLAEKFNVTRQAVTKWENAECMPDIYSILEMAKFFDTTVEELVLGEKKEEDPREAAKRLYLKFVENLEDLRIAETVSDEERAKELKILIKRAGFVLPKELTDELWEISDAFGAPVEDVLEKYKGQMEEPVRNWKQAKEKVLKILYQEVEMALEEYLG